MSVRYRAIESPSRLLALLFLGRLGRLGLAAGKRRARRGRGPALGLLDFSRLGRDGRRFGLGRQEFGWQQRRNGGADGTGKRS